MYLSLCWDPISAWQEAISPCCLCKGKMLCRVHRWLPQASWKWSLFAPFWWYPSFFPRASAPLTVPCTPCRSLSVLSSVTVLGKQ